MEGINIAHGASHELEGEDVLNIQDTKGAYITQDMIEIVDSQGKDYQYWTQVCLKEIVGTKTCGERAF